MPRKDETPLPQCPHCGSDEISSARLVGSPLLARQQCHACRRWFEVTPAPPQRLPKPCPDCAGSRDGPIVRAPQPQPAAEGSLAYRPGAPALAPVAAERLPCPRPGCGSRFGPTATEPCLRCGGLDAFFTVAAALCLSPDDFARDAVALLAHAGPAAYLRLLRDKDPAAWGERILVILTATGGNFSQAAARVGLTYRGLLKAILSDPKLQQEISERWPARHERGLVR